MAIYVMKILDEALSARGIHNLSVVIKFLRLDNSHLAVNNI